MKKVLFVLLLSLFCLFKVDAQDMKFMGLDLNTKFETFCQKLKDKGLEVDVVKSASTYFKGTFAGHKNCKIIVSCTDITKVVKSVEVVFPYKYDEDARNDAWRDIFQQYRNKYGSYITIEDGDNVLNFYRYDFKSSTVNIALQRMGPNMLDDETTFSIVYENLKVSNESSTGAGKYSDDL